MAFAHCRQCAGCETVKVLTSAQPGFRSVSKMRLWLTKLPLLTWTVVPQVFALYSVMAALRCFSNSLMGRIADLRTEFWSLA